MAKALVDKLVNKVWIFLNSESEKRNDEPNKQEEDKASLTTYENLIMGVSRSGKTTLFQQLARIHIDGGKFSDETRMQRRNKIRKYVIDYLVEVLITIPSPLTSLRNMALAKWLIHNIKMYNFDKSFDHPFHKKLPRNFFNLQNLFDILWKDQVFKNYLRNNDFFSSKDNMDYFLDSIRTILRPDYIPTDEDILQCPIFSNNVAELHLEFLVNSHLYKFIFVDTGREKSDYLKSLCWEKLRKKFIPRLPRGARDFIIFLVDCSTPKQLSRSLKMLEDLYMTCRFCFIMIYVVLNKVDILKKYISSEGSLESFFADFSNFPAFMSSFNDSRRPRRVWKHEVERRTTMAVTFLFEQVQCVEYPFHKKRCYVLNSGVTNDNDVIDLMKEFLQGR